MNNIKKITITTTKDEEIEFVPKFPVKISQHFGIRDVPQKYGMITKEHNGLETLVIISAPEHIMDEIFPNNDVVKRLINTNEYNIR